MTKIGLIGCGAIGTEIATEVSGGRVGNAEIAALFDMDAAIADALAQRLGGDSIPAFTDMDEFLSAPGLEMVVECASPSAVKAHAEKVLSAGKDLMVVSSGALTDTALFQRLGRPRRAAGPSLHHPHRRPGGHRRHSRYAGSSGRSSPDHHEAAAWAHGRSRLQGVGVQRDNGSAGDLRWFGPGGHQALSRQRKRRGYPEPGRTGAGEDSREGGGRTRIRPATCTRYTPAAALASCGLPWRTAPTTGTPAPATWPSCRCWRPSERPAPPARVSAPSPFPRVSAEALWVSASSQTESETPPQK